MKFLQDKIEGWTKCNKRFSPNTRSRLFLGRFSGFLVQIATTIMDHDDYQAACFSDGPVTSYSRMSEKTQENSTFVLVLQATATKMTKNTKVCI